MITGAHPLEQDDVVGPRQFGHRWWPFPGRNRVARVRPIERPHPSQVSRGQTVHLRKRRAEVRRDAIDDAAAPGLLLHPAVEIGSNRMVEEQELLVHRRRGREPRTTDASLDVPDQPRIAHRELGFQGRERKRRLGATSSSRTTLDCRRGRSRGLLPRTCARVSPRLHVPSRRRRAKKRTSASSLQSNPPPAARKSGNRFT